MKDQVRRMAENDEPKCGNCGWWRRIADDKTAGDCAFNQTPKIVGASVNLNMPITTDLSLCSAWEPKE